MWGMPLNTDIHACQVRVTSQEQMRGERAITLLRYTQPTINKLPGTSSHGTGDKTVLVWKIC